MSDPAAAASFHFRLERLERENRRYKLAALLSGLLLFAWAACSGAPPLKNVVSAERFVLVSPDGSEKAVLELDSKGNPALQLRNGESVALLTTNGPSLLLRGADGKTGAFVGIDSKNTSRLELCSERLIDGVRLSVHPDGTSGVYVLDRDGRKRGGLEAFSTGGAGLSFHDPLGRMRAQLGLDPANLPNLILLDEDGVRRLGMILREDAQPLIEMADEQGRPRVQIATAFDGSPQLELKRDDGTATFRAP